MAIFAYNNNDADQTSEELNTIMNNIESTLGEMDSDIRKLGESWEGSEQEEYQAIHSRWSGAAKNLQNILGQIRGALDESTSNVAEGRGRVSSAIAGN